MQELNDIKHLDPEPCPMGTYNIVDTVLDVEGEPGAGVLHHHHGAGGSAASRLETLHYLRLMLQKVASEGSYSRRRPLLGPSPG